MDLRSTGRILRKLQKFGNHVFENMVWVFSSIQDATNGFVHLHLVARRFNLRATRCSCRWRRFGVHVGVGWLATDVVADLHQREEDLFYDRSGGR